MCGLSWTEEELKMEASLNDLFKGSEPPPPNISIFICAAMLLCVSFKLVAVEQVSSALPQVYFSDPLLKFYVDKVVSKAKTETQTKLVCISLNSLI